MIRHARAAFTQSASALYQTLRDPERLAMLLLALVLLAASANWGLSSPARVELLGFKELSAADRAALSTVRTAKASEREAFQNEAASKLAAGERVSIFRNEYDAAAELDHDTKLYALGSYLLNSSAHDEGQTFHALAAMKPAKLDFDPHMYIYGGSYLYPLGGVLFAMRAVGLIHVTSDVAAYGDHPEWIARLYLAGRWLNILAFIGIMMLLPLLAERAVLSDGSDSSKRTVRIAGSLAMLMWLCSTQALDQALISKPHLYAAFFSLLAIAPAVLKPVAGGRQNLSTRRLIAAGCAAGWAMGASLPCFLIYIPLACLVISLCDIPGSLRRLFIIGVAMAVIFTVTNPYVFLRFHEFRTTLQGHGTSEGYGYAALSLSKLFGFCREIFVRGYAFPLSFTALRQLGIAIAPANLPPALNQKNASWLRPLAFGTSLMIIICGTSVAVARIALFIGPLVCLYASLPLARFIQQTRFGAAVVTLLAIPCIFFAAMFFDETIRDNRWQAPLRQWLAEMNHTQQMTRVGIFGSGQPHPANLPPFPFVTMNIFNLHKSNSDRDLPDYIFVSYDDRDFWNHFAQRERYREIKNLGLSSSRDWFAAWRVASEAQTGAIVYALK